MSGLRAHTKTSGPDGRAWEIYAYRRRVELPEGVRFRGIRAWFAPREADWTIEASSWAPYPLRHRWKAAPEFKGHVLARVEGQLARGETPMPRNAIQLL
jgi:hypothetical protein